MNTKQIEMAIKQAFTIIIVDALTASSETYRETALRSATNISRGLVQSDIEACKTVAETVGFGIVKGICASLIGRDTITFFNTEKERDEFILDFNEGALKNVDADDVAYIPTKETIRELLLAQALVKIEESGKQDSRVLH